MYDVEKLNDHDSASTCYLETVGLQRENCLSQCGFRRHSCTNMIFMVWQLSERAIEHNSKQFFVFVNSRIWPTTVIWG